MFSTFVAESQQNGLAAYAEMQDALKNSLAISAADMDLLETYTRDIDKKSEKITTLNGQLTEWPLSVSDSLQKEGQRQLYADSLSTILNLYETKWSTILTARMNGVANLLGQNNALSGTAIYQINEKTVNDIFIQSILNGHPSLTATQRSVLEAIAIQCPLSGGEAVLRARAIMVALGSLPMAYDDEKICFAQQRLGVEDRGNHTNHPTGVWVYPNPAHDLLNIAWYDSGETAPKLEVFDAYGRAVRSVNLAGNAGSTQLDISQLPAGIYVYHVYLSGAASFSNKLTIQH